MRRLFLIIAFSLLLLVALGAWMEPAVLWSLIVIVPPLALGFYDYFQPQHAIRRNFPLVGRMRYLLESIRPEIYQYFVESETDGGSGYMVTDGDHAVL